MRKIENVITLVSIIFLVICTVWLYIVEGEVWTIGIFGAASLSLVMIWDETNDKDIITRCARDNDLNGLFDYAYYVAGQGLEIKSALEKGRISEIHARILLKYCSYRIGKSLRTAQRAFNLDYDDLRKRIDEFAEEKFRKEREYRQRVEELQKDANTM